MRQRAIGFTGLLKKISFQQHYDEVKCTYTAIDQNIDNSISANNLDYFMQASHHYAASNDFNGFNYG